MQQILYDDRPEIVLWYETYLQAYRSDRWTGFIEQPPVDGAILFQYGYHSLLNIQPVSGESTGGDDGGIPALVWIGVAGVAVVVVGLVLARRRRSEEEAA
jgi:peptide/nickel transport system substrate-binding protein